MIIIGDTHNKIDPYETIINSPIVKKVTTKVKTIHVGDYGFKAVNDWHMNNVNPEEHKVNFGNHDYYPYMFEKHSIGNFKYFPEYGIFCIRGAFSTDRRARTEGLDWFYNEELNYEEFQACLDLYMKVKPKYVISHDCPKIVAMHVMNVFGNSTTGKMLDHLFDIHRPEKWMFGHHHYKMHYNMFGTEFICIPTNGIYNLEI